MLRPHEFSVGVLGDANGLTLLLPRTRYEGTFLIAPHQGEMHAASLAGNLPFHSFNCRDNDAWKGVLVTGIGFEVDPASVFDAAEEREPYGALVRKGSNLSLVTKPAGDFFIRQSFLLPVAGDLPPTHEGMTAGFRSWVIIVGEGLSRRELLRANLASDA